MMDRYDIPLPRLLNSSGGTERLIRPTKVSIDLNIIPLSSATMELPVGESLPARAYVELFSPLGSVGIFRVRSPQDAYGEDITTAELEHSIVEVGDYVVKEDKKQMMAAGAAMQRAFSHYGGTRWQLGSVAAMGNAQIVYQVNYERVLEAMIALLEQVPDCMMAFDFSTTPWTVSIVKKGTTVTAEGRLSRNVNYARVIYDDTELCTRAYYERETTGDAKTDNFPTFKASERYGKGTYLVYDGKLYKLTADHAKNVSWANTSKQLMNNAPASGWSYIDSDTVGTYGVIERTVQTGSDYTQAEATRVVNEYLRQHKNPRISVEIGAEELSKITGEDLDTFQIGKLFRLVLIDYGGVSVEQWITQISWGDVYNAPADMIVGLAAEEDTAITFLHDVDQKGGSGGGGGGGKKQDEKWKEYRTRFEQDDYHFNLVAERLNRAEEVLQQAGLYIDANGVLIYAEDNEAQLAGKIKVQADRISLVVEGTGENAHIKPASIVAAINAQTGESTIKISADVIDIDGVVKSLEAKDVMVANFNAANGEFTGNLNVLGDCAFLDVEADDVEVSTLSVDGDSATWQTKTVVTGVGVTLPSITRSTSRHFLYSNISGGTTAAGTQTGQLVTGYTAGSVSPATETIYYLGRTV